MSDQVRDVIASKKKLLQRQLSTVPNFPAEPKPPAGQGAEESVIELQAMESQVEDQLRRLNNGVAAIETAQAEWTRILNNRTEKERERDQQAYQDFMAGDNNPTATLDLVATTVEGLEDLLVKVRSELAKARLAVEKAAEAARDKQRQHDLAMANANADAAKATQAAQTLATLPTPPQSQPVVKDKLKLPVIEPTKFAGSREEFWGWWRLYKATVHDNPNESDLLKMTRLYALVEGPAMDILAGLDITADNYPKAIQLLSDHYGDEQSRVKELIFQLESLPSCRNMTEVGEFSLKLEKVCLQLESLKHPIDSMCWIRLQAKLTLTVIKELQKTERADPKGWNMDKFRAELKRLVKEDEDAHRVKGLTKREEKPEKSGSPKDKSPKKKEKSIVYATQEGNSQGKGSGKEQKPRPKSEPRCQFRCSTKKPHWSNQCLDYQTLAERKSRAKELSLCYKCLQDSHMAGDCPSKTKCYKCQSSGHTSAMCDRKAEPSKPESKRDKKKDEKPKPKRKPPEKDKKSKNDDESGSEQGHAVAAANLDAERGKRTSVSMCVRAEVFNPRSGKKKMALVVFDTLCHVSFIKDELRKELDLPTEDRVSLPLLTFKAKKAKDHECDRVRLGIQLVNGKELKLDFFTTETIISDSAAVLLTEDDLSKAATYGNWVGGTKENPDILIGIDHEGLFDIKNLRGAEPLASGFILKSTLLGPILSGRGQLKLIKRHPPVHTASVVHQAIEEDVSNQQLLEDHFKIESLGIEPDYEVSSDERTLQFFRETRKRVNGRFEVSLPWNEDIANLPTNYAMVEKRAVRTSEQIQRDPDLLVNCPKAMKSWRDNEVIEKVRDPWKKLDRPIHYLAIRVVKKVGPDGNVKVRLTLDAAAAPHGLKSLNQCLERGPVLLHDLGGLVMRFRTGAIAVLSDVEKAFLQLLLNDDDRDATRFLWPKNLNDLSQGFDVYRFCRLPFGLKPSPFLLAGTMDDFLAAEQTPVSEEVRRNVYVDNVLIRAKSPAEAEAKCREARALFDKAKMPLREFVSNSKEAIAFLSSDDKLPSRVNKVLGLNWDIETDELIFKFPKWDAKQQWTLRAMTKMVSKMYDPCGLWTPCVIQAKVALAEVWKWFGDQPAPTEAHKGTVKALTEKKVKWDSPLPDLLQTSWKNAIAHWKDAEVAVDRRVTTLHADGCKYELNAFGDASKDAFGTCVYLVSRLGEKAEARLVLSKSRVRPSQGKWTIPRLELMAALVSTRALNYVKAELDVPIESCTVWSDAQCVIDWIISPDRQERFVENRRKEIRENKEFHLQHVPGKQNPADLLSRGRTVSELIGEDYQLWFHGPEWLLDKSKRPGEGWRIGDLPEAQAQAEVMVEVAAAIQPLIDRLDPADTRFPNWRQKRRIVGYVLKFIKKKLLDRLGTQRALPEFLTQLAKLDTGTLLTAMERNFAGMYLIKQEQKRHPPSKDVVKELGIYTDERGILRCKLRLDESELEEQAKRLIFLDKDSPLTHLIVLDTHQKIHHLGVKNTLVNLRKLYWIPGGRRVVGTTIRRRCPITGCLRYTLESFAPRVEPNLPTERVTLDRVFDHTGLDYAGPFTVKLDDGSESKVYVLLLTCMSTRNIHLEVARDYSTDSFLLAFRRFVSRRGSPKSILSDHGSQFELGAKVVTEAFQSKGFQAYLAERNIRWRFVTEKAPWAGGFYESLVKLLKRSLRRTMGKSVMRVDRFTTLVTEIEGFVNGRPLTFLSDQLEPASVRPLRPIDFLFPAGDSVEPAELEDDGGDYCPTSRENLLAKFAKDQQKITRFKREFYENYLPSLRERKSKMGRGVAREPELGEVVLLEGDDPNRLSWQIGRIVELVRSKDGAVRTVKLFVKNKLLRRPINLLYPLEMDPKPTSQAEKDEPDRIKVVRKGKVLNLKLGSEAPPRPEGRTHKMRLRNHRPVDDDVHASPVLTFSCMLGSDVPEELDYDESMPAEPTPAEVPAANPAPSASCTNGVEAPSTLSQSAPEKAASSVDREPRRPHAPVEVPGGLVAVTTEKGKLKARAKRFIKAHLNSAVENGEELLAKAEALKKRQAEIESKVMDRNQAWPKWSRRTFQGRGRGSGIRAHRRYEPYRRYDMPRSRHPSPSPTAHCSHRHRSRDGKEKIGDREKRSRSPLGMAAAAAKQIAKRVINASVVREPTPPTTPVFHELSLETDTGLEVTKACRHCKGIRLIDLDIDLYFYHQTIAYERIRSPALLILVQCALRLEKSLRTVEFTKELLMCADSFEKCCMAWAKWRKKSPSQDLKDIDATKALELYVKQCPQSGTHLQAAEPKPFRWRRNDANDEKVARTWSTAINDEEAVARAWTSAINDEFAKRLGRKPVKATTVILGDQWAAQFGMSLQETYFISDPWPLVAKELEKLFLGNVRDCVMFAGKDRIQYDTESSDEFADVLRALPPHVRTIWLEPPRIPGHGTSWSNYKKAIKKVKKSMKDERAIYVSLPQLNGKDVAPQFIAEAIEPDGDLKDLGALIVLHQLNYKANLQLCFKDKPAKPRKIRGFYSQSVLYPSEEEKRPALEQRMQEFCEARPQPQPSKGKMASTTLGTGLCLASLLVLMCWTGLGAAVDPMTCRKDNSILYDLGDYLSACTLPLGEDAEEHPRALKVFHNNTEAHGRIASQCFRKVEEIAYGSAIGLHSSNPPKVHYKKVTADECRDWLRTRKCEFGENDSTEEKLESDGDVLRTGRKAEVDYGSWYNPFSWGNSVASAENCFIMEVPIAVSSLLDHVVSEAGDTRGCRYSSGQCQLPDKSVLVWNPESGLTCPFQELGVWQGTYYFEKSQKKYIWTADHGQFVLSFHEDTTPVSVTCDADRGAQYVIADSGLAISVKSFDDLRRYRSKRSQKTPNEAPNAEVEMVRSDVLATQLTAVSKHCEKNDRKISKRLRDFICSVAKDVYTPSKVEATIVARAILGIEYVQAEFPTTRPIMEVWRCQRLGTLSNTSFLPTVLNGQCYKRPLVQITTDSGETLRRHLDTRLMIATESSELGPCEVHRSHVVEINGKLWRVNQETGAMTEEPSVIKLIHGVNNSWTLPDLDLLEFRNWVLMKHDDPLAQEEAKIRARKAQESISEKSMVHDKGASSYSQQSRIHLPTMDEFLFGWMPKPPTLLTNIVIYAVSIKIAWLIFCNWVWPWVAVKLLRKLLPERYQQWVPQGDESGTHRQLMEQVREQQRHTEELMKQMKQQLDLLRSPATATQRPSTSRTHVYEAMQMGSAEDGEDHGLGALGRGTTERKTTRLQKSLRERAFLKPGVSGSDHV